MVEKKIKAKNIKCPGCGQMTLYSLENPARPFCSARCKNDDITAWANEEFYIPDKQVQLDHDENND